MMKRILHLFPLLLIFGPLSTFASTEKKGEIYNVSLEMNTYRLDEMGFNDKKTGLSNRSVIPSRRAELIFLDETTVRFRFEKPLVLDLVSKDKSESRIQRILSHFDIQLSERQNTNFTSMRQMDAVRATMVNEIPEEQINFREFMDKVHTLKAKDYGDGRIYRVPLLVKPVNTLHLQNVALDQILQGKTQVVGVSIETRIIQNINLAENRLSFLPEFHRVHLAEAMEHVFIQDSRIANVARFREEARLLREQGLRNMYANTREFSQPEARTTTVSKSVPMEKATILHLNPNTKLCRTFIGSKQSTGNVIQLNF